MKSNTMDFTIGMIMTRLPQKLITRFINRILKVMTNQAFFRSCEVVMFHKKLTTSLIANNNLIKNLPCYRGRHISNNITQLSKVFQRCYKLFKLFIYKGFPSTTSQNVFGTADRVRKIMHIGRQVSTSPGSCKNIPGPGDRLRRY